MGICKCGFCNVWVSVSVGMCMCGYVYVWVCVCVGMCMCGYVYVWGLQCVGVLIIVRVFLVICVLVNQTIRYEYIVRHNYVLGGMLFTICKAQLHVSAINVGHLQVVQ